MKHHNRAALLLAVVLAGLLGAVGCCKDVEFAKYKPFEVQQRRRVGFLGIHSPSKTSSGFFWYGIGAAETPGGTGVVNNAVMKVFSADPNIDLVDLSYLAWDSSPEQLETVREKYKLDALLHGELVEFAVGGVVVIIIDDVSFTLQFSDAKTGDALWGAGLSGTGLWACPYDIAVELCEKALSKLNE